MPMYRVWCMYNGGVVRLFICMVVTMLYHFFAFDVMFNNYGDELHHLIASPPKTLQPLHAPLLHTTIKLSCARDTGTSEWINNRAFTCIMDKCSYMMVACYPKRITSAPPESPGRDALDLALVPPGFGLDLDEASPYAAFNACIFAIWSTDGPLATGSDGADDDSLRSLRRDDRWGDLL